MLSNSGWDCLSNEIQDAGGQVIHCPCDFDGSFFLKVSQDWATAANLANSKHHVRPGNRIHVGRILAGLLTIKFCGRDRRFDARQQSSEIAENHIVDCAFNGSARSVSQNQHDLSAGNATGKLHATQHVVIYYVTGDSANKDVTDTRVENDLGWHSRIKTAKHDRCRVLPGCAGSFLSQIISWCHFACSKPPVAFLQFIDDLSRGHAVALL